jgi:hypothetical protein
LQLKNNKKRNAISVPIAEDSLAKVYGLCLVETGEIKPEILA